MDLLKKHAEALREKKAALVTCKKWGVLTHPKIVYEAHKWTRMEIDYRVKIQTLADILITNQKLYEDLCLSKNS